METIHLTRRSLIAGLAATAGLTVAGCAEARTPKSEPESKSRRNSAATTPAPAAMTVYRDPSCGCCEAWAAIARDAGYQVRVIDHPNIAVIKRRYGVPDGLLSCHTTIVGGYAIEGHVPLEDVQRLLKRRPPAMRGIGVAGMPLGSPGMEVPDGTKEPFRVMAFDEARRVSVFRG